MKVFCFLHVSVTLLRYQTNISPEYEEMFPISYKLYQTFLMNSSQGSKPYKTRDKQIDSTRLTSEIQRTTRRRQQKWQRNARINFQYQPQAIKVMLDQQTPERANRWQNKQINKRSDAYTGRRRKEDERPIKPKIPKVQVESDVSARDAKIKIRTYELLVKTRQNWSGPFFLAAKNG